MRIPPSVIVMSVVTAVPFGLAIRDARSPTERVPLVDPVQEALARQVRIRRDAAEAEARARHARMIAGFVGNAVATVGPMLDGIALGEKPSQDALEATEVVPVGWTAVMRDRDERVVGIEVVLEGSDCDLLRDRLTAAWGPGDLWIDREHHRRASLTDCRLELDRYADPADWLALVHDEVVGAPLDRALAVLGPANDVSSNDYGFWLPGLGAGTGPTQLDLYVLDGKVVTMRIMTTAPAAEVTAIRDALAAKLHGKPVENEEGSSHEWSWPRHSPAFTLQHANGQMVALDIEAH